MSNERDAAGRRVSPRVSRGARRRRWRPAGVLSPCIEHLEPRLLLSFTDVTSTVFPGATSINPWFFDYDNDGWLDAAIFTNHWRLMHNDRGVFSDAGVLSDGLPPGQAFAGDIDNDGWVDLFVGHQGFITVLRNAEGTGSFEKVTHVPPDNGIVAGGGSVGDFNNDGFLDFYRGGYVSNNSQLIVSVPDATQPGGRGFDLVWQGDGRYVRSVTSADYDEDGDLDVYTAAYFLQNNALYQNQRNGQPFPFTNAGLNESGHSVGAQWGDLDNDGDLDLFLGNFAHSGNPESRVFRNEGPGGSYAMADIGQRGVFFRESWASPALGDYDNDGNLDLFLSAFGPPGYSSSDTSALFRNTPDSGGPNFGDVTSAQGLGGLYVGNDKWVDYDDDGDLDLVAGGKLFRNSPGNANSWLKVDLGGDANSIGAIVKVTAGGTTRTRQVESGNGEARFSPLLIHFGLGSQAGPVDVEITWLDGTTRAFQTAVNQTIDGGPGTTATALPYVENFDDGTAHGLGFALGDWYINTALRLRATPRRVGENTLAVLNLVDALPEALSICAIMRSKDADEALQHNGFIVFDHQDEQNFKFAGPFFGAGAWRIGRVSGGDWLFDASGPGTFELETDYDVTVRIIDGTVTIVADGVEQVTHTYGGDLRDGGLGLGTRNADTVFDDVTAAALAALPYAEDFDDGRADHLIPWSGAWLINAALRLRATPAAAGGDTVALLNLAVDRPDALELRAIMRSKDDDPNLQRNGFFIFDHQDAANFKFAGPFFGADLWRIGHVSDGVWSFDADGAAALALETNYDVTVRIVGPTVAVLAGGVEQVGHSYGDDPGDGSFGLGTRNADTVFDDVSVTSLAQLPYAEDFNDGTPDHLVPTAGDWVVNPSLRLRATPVAAGGDTVALLNLAGTLPEALELRAIMRSKDADPVLQHNGFFIFDYQDAANFKFAGPFFGADLWRIGHVSDGAWTFDADGAAALELETDHDVTVRMVGPTVTILADGGALVAHSFGGDLRDGALGLGTRNADTVFDDLSVTEVALVVTVDSKVTGNARPSLTGTVDHPTATVEVIFGAQVLRATNTGDGTWMLADGLIAEPLAEGTHDVVVRATLPSGTASYDTTVDELVIDLTAPRVIGVLLDGTSWDQSFRDALDGQAGAGGGSGYWIPTGSAAQLTPLPWAGIDRVGLLFSEPVDRNASVEPDLSVQGLSDTAYTTAGLTWSDDRTMAIWLLGGPVDTDRLQVELSDVVHDAAGNPLDGEWEDGVSTQSGDGAPGGVFRIALNVSPGDLDGDGITSVRDNRDLRAALAASVYVPWADQNGDGRLDRLDVRALRQRIGGRLPGV